MNPTPDAGVVPCPLCDCPIQRTSTGTLTDGMKAHYSYVHPKERLPTQLPTHPA